jgi:hypothetical protein
MKRKRSELVLANKELHSLPAVSIILEPLRKYKLLPAELLNRAGKPSVRIDYILEECSSLPVCSSVIR